MTHFRNGLTILSQFVFLPLIFVFIMYFECQSQTNYSEVNRNLARDKVSDLSKSTNPSSLYLLHGESNGFKIFFKLLLQVYKRTISEQISAECEFDLSCSSFSWQAFESAGIISGLLLTADRLTRCNGAAGIECESFLVNRKTGKVIDEPQMYLKK